MVMPVYKQIGFLPNIITSSENKGEELGSIIYELDAQRGESVATQEGFSLKGKPMSFLRIGEIPGKFVLRDQIVLNVEIENGWVSLESELLRIKVSNTDVQKALEDFNDYFCFDYENYVLEDESALSPDAIALKNKYIQLVS